jgi:F-type H+-transporting ATPase subunit b
MQEILNILGSLGFNWHVALANFVNFLIILFLLNKFFFGKIGKTLSEREKIIECGLTQAHEAERKLAHAEEEKDEIIKGAHKEKGVILANAESLAREVASTLEQEAQASIVSRMKKLEEEEKAITATVEKAFAQKAPYLVAAMYAKTLANEMTKEDNEALIARMSA